jgi:hypothetical protein
LTDSPLQNFNHRYREFSSRFAVSYFEHEFQGNDFEDIIGENPLRVSLTFLSTEGVLDAQRFTPFESANFIGFGMKIGGLLIKSSDHPRIVTMAWKGQSLTGIGDVVGVLEESIRP